MILVFDSRKINPNLGCGHNVVENGLDEMRSE